VSAPGPNRQQVEGWRAEWMRSQRGHWGDGVDWDTAFKIADRLDEFEVAKQAGREAGLKAALADHSREICEPFDCWKSHEFQSGRWTAVRDRKNGETLVREYDFEEVRGFDRSERRQLHFIGPEACDWRCWTLNHGLAHPGDVNDQRSSWPRRTAKGAE
jgi:hypothetical protein